MAQSSRLGNGRTKRDSAGERCNHGIKSYKKFQVAIPFGIGARFRLNEMLDLSAELGFRYLFTDYIDDVSKNYVDLGVFGNDELAKAMSYRTNEVVDPSLLKPTQTRNGQTIQLVARLRSGAC